jgi:hypothetical protein
MNQLVLVRRLLWGLAVVLAFAAAPRVARAEKMAVLILAAGDKDADLADNVTEMVIAAVARQRSGVDVVTAGRHAKTPIHHTNWKGVAAPLDHAVLHFCSLTKNVAASIKKSRSFFNGAFLRLSCIISSSRA